MIQTRYRFVAVLSVGLFGVLTACSGGSSPALPKIPTPTTASTIPGIDVSIPWTTATVASDGRTIFVQHVQTCVANAHVVATESPTQVVIEVLTTELPETINKCNASISGNQITTVIRLQAPVGKRILVHGAVTGKA